MMPGITAPSLTACIVILWLAGAYVVAVAALIAAVVARIRKQRAIAGAAQTLAATAFLVGIILSVYFSWVSRGSFEDPTWLLVSAAIPVAAGVIAAVVATMPRAGFIAGCALIALAAVLMARDARYRSNRDAIIVATKAGDAIRVRQLIARGANPDLRTFNGDNLLALTKDVATLQVLLEGGANVNGDPRALVWAAKDGDLPKLKLLLEHGANPNTKTGYTPARYAFWYHHDDALELLRQHGARDAATFQQAKGKLLQAAEASDAKAVERALAGEYLEEDREKALQIAAERGDVASVSAIFEKTAAYFEVAKVLTIAVERDDPKLTGLALDTLLARQAGYTRIEAIDEALSIAARHRYRDIAAVIVEKQGGVNARDADGFHGPLLHRAAHNNDLAAVTLLLEMGATPNVSDWLEDERPTDPVVLKTLHDAEARSR